MVKVIRVEEDKINRRTIKLYNDTDDTTIVVSEFYTDDNISVANTIKGDSFNFVPDRALMQQIVEAVIDYKENGIREDKQ